jgi:hypothetical protein
MSDASNVIVVWWILSCDSMMSSELFGFVFLVVFLNVVVAQPAYNAQCGYMVRWFYLWFFFFFFFFFSPRATRLQAIDFCNKLSMGYDPSIQRWVYINDTIESGCFDANSKLASSLIFFFIVNKHIYNFNQKCHTFHELVHDSTCFRNQTVRRR